jgi:hypothetical protein
VRERVREQSIGRSFGLGLLLVVAMACVVPASAFAATAHEYESSFGPDCTEATNFEAPGAVAVDQQIHDIYVADLELSLVSKFDENHELAVFSTLAFNESAGTLA